LFLRLYIGLESYRDHQHHPWPANVHSRPEGDAPPKGLIVIIPDIFGWSLINTQVLADEYAKECGFLVYLPDFMNGNKSSSSPFTALN